jgi:cytochrome c biogenesis protein CcdA
MAGSSADVLVFAVAAALTPTAILAGLLLLLTPRPRQNGAAFVSGWMLGIMLAALILLRLASPPSVTTQLEDQPLVRPGIVVLAGLAMIIGGVLGLRSQRRDVKEPAWLKRVDSFSPGASFGLGLVLGGLSPKLIFLTAAAVVTLVLYGTSPLEEFIGLIVYVLVASLPILIPVLFVFSRQESAVPRLAAWKTWLIAHQGRVMGAGSILLGLLLVGFAFGSAAAG